MSSYPTLPNQQDPGRAHWLFWELGLLAALAAIIATPADTNPQAAFGVISLLFLMGLAHYQGPDKN